jgi:hypothetical protein
MAQSSIHVVPYGAEDWVVKEEASGRELGHYPTQAAAEEVARALARKRQVELVIHDAKGGVQRQAVRRKGWFGRLFGR